jgi:hypothetical protein
MEKEIADWFSQITNCTDNKQIKSIVDGFDLTALMKQTANPADTFMALVKEEVKKIPLDKMPLVLDALYQSPSKVKFTLFCHLLELTYGDLPSLTNLEKYAIPVEKFKDLLPTLVRVVGQGCNLDTCMWLILLKNISHKNLLDENQVATLTQKIETETDFIVQYLEKNNFDASERIAWAIGIVSDVAGHFNTEKTLKNLGEFLKTKSREVKLFSAGSLIRNDIAVDAEVLDNLAHDVITAERLLRQFEVVGKTDQYPATFARQDWIAQSKMVDWLLYPTELGKMPTEIELLGTISRGGHDFFAFKFTTDLEKLGSRGWMLGICGGFEQGKLTSGNQSTGATFSKFETVQEDYVKQGTELIDFIENYWKERAKKMQGQ